MSPPYATLYSGLAVVGPLAVFGDVQAFLFRLRAHPQAGDHLDQEEDDRAADARPGDGEQHRLQLRHDLEGQVVGALAGGDIDAARAAGGIVDDALTAPGGVD